MIQEPAGWFGQSISDFLGVTHQIIVDNAPKPPPPAFYNSTFISQSLQGNPHINGIQPGAKFAVGITMKNSGNYTSNPWIWSDFFLGSINPRDNHNWGTNRIRLDVGGIVTFGETVTFQAVLTAPLTEGVYNFQWQMLNNEQGWFGVETENLTITVTNTAPVINLNDAKFISMNVPDQVLRGSPFTADITFI
jgi:hypothetical protein